MSAPGTDPEKRKRRYRPLLASALIGLAVLAIVTALYVSFGSDSEAPISHTVTPATDQGASGNESSTGY